MLCSTIRAENQAHTINTHDNSWCGNICIDDDDKLLALLEMTILGRKYDTVRGFLATSMTIPSELQLGVLLSGHKLSTGASFSSSGRWNVEVIK